MPTQSVHDGIANKNETLEHHAQVLARSPTRAKIFAEIYRGKSPPKTAEAIAATLQISPKDVNGHALALIRAGMVVRESVKPKSGRVVLAYGRTDFCRLHKAAILSLARDPSKLSKLPTKRRPSVVSFGTTIKVTLPKELIRIKHITVDDIDSFERVRAIKSSAITSGAMSETHFKKGIASVVGENAVFKDWGGESSDLMTTRVTLGGKRVASAFAFKGPGLKSKLVPGRMGKNGDQCQRLFSEPAELFVVHHWREIDPSVIQLMKALATAKSATEGKLIYYCVIDGQDSSRLIEAYPEAFK